VNERRKKRDIVSGDFYDVKLAIYYGVFGQRERTGRKRNKEIPRI